PYWNPRLAVDELQRNVARGAVAVAFSENPYRQGFPAIHDPDHYWDPVFAAVQEAEIPLCVHFGSSSWIFQVTPGVQPMALSLAPPLNSQPALIEWLAGGVFERFPGLRVVCSESYLGWIPFVLEHCDRSWARNFEWAADRSVLPRPPSEYFRDNVSVC